MLTLAPIIPVFHQVEEVMESNKKVLVEMIKSSVPAGANQSTTQGNCRCAESSPVPKWEAKGQGSSSLGSAQLKGDQVPQLGALGKI